MTFNELERRHGVVLRLDHMVAQKAVVVRLNFLDRIVLDLDDVFEADKDLQRRKKIFQVTISTKINSTILSFCLKRRVWTVISHLPTSCVRTNAFHPVQI